MCRRVRDGCPKMIGRKHTFPAKSTLFEEIWMRCRVGTVAAAGACFFLETAVYVGSVGTFSALGGGKTRETKSRLGRTGYRTWVILRASRITIGCLAAPPASCYFLTNLLYFPSRSVSKILAAVWSFQRRPYLAYHEVLEDDALRLRYEGGSVLESSPGRHLASSVDTASSAIGAERMCARTRGTDT